MSIKENTHLLKRLDNKQQIPSMRNEVHRRIVNICEQLKKRGVHLSASMSAAGWIYEDDSDTAHCQTCGLKVSGWTKEMKPFVIHAERSPNCSFVQSKNAMGLSSTSTSTINNQENPLKHRKIDPSTENLLVEVETLKEIRRRTFSHWPHRQTPSAAQMISAGFFSCNVGDRVICLYCNLICQQWMPHTDNPQEVHQTLSPQCVYVQLMLKIHQTTPISILNESSTNNSNAQPRTLDIRRLNEIVLTTACHISYVEIPKRQASFASWPQESLPSVDDLVRAGFFYSGTKTVVTCFYCNGSLQNWGPKDNPTVEHCRWFPHCAYARQLCGDELYRKIQESKRTAQEHATANQSGRNNNTHSTNSPRLLIPDENTLSRFVAARLDLPISQSLLNRNFKLSIIKRCWEDQLRLKQDDFVSDCDLFIACVILQKQIENINGNKENIIVPNVRMKLIREKEQNQTLPREQLTSAASVPIVDGLASENHSSQKNIKASTTSGTKESDTKVKANPENSSSSSNLCVLCWTVEKRLACIPCGHLATCVPCGHSLRTCPICRREIEAFVRIYI